MTAPRYGHVEWDDRQGHHHEVDTITKDQQRRICRILRRSGRVITRASVGLLVAAPLLMAAPALAGDAPYGGCKEAYQAPQSPGARDCRQRGWVIRPRLVVTPDRWIVFTRLPHCRYEDGSGQRSACTWNVGTPQDGNGRGRAYWVDLADRVHYVKGLR